jgi:hypothetical protein
MIGIPSIMGCRHDAIDEELDSRMSETTRIGSQVRHSEEPLSVHARPGSMAHRRQAGHPACFAH